jgi:O-antigen biosynthesis protein WbqP
MLSRSLGIIVLIILSPLLFVVSGIIFLDDGFPILFKQKRIGFRNRVFFVYKFRTMRNGIPDVPTHLLKAKDTLFTRSGSILRKLSIDELPQLLNILKGEMFFVGPRPALYNQEDLITLRTKVGVHMLLPGITGWAQVNGRDELSIEQKVTYDEYYLNNRSLRMNLKIIIMTVLKVLKMHSVSH